MSGVVRDGLTTRRLAPEDAARYRELWLDALREHPAAFSAAYEDEADIPMEGFGARIASVEIYGVFDAGGLAGFVTLQRSPLPKRRHVGHIAGMYVAPGARGGGAARVLLGDVLALAAGHVDQVELFVACGNARARRLYERFGFETYGRMRRALRVGGVDHDADMLVRDFLSEG